MGGVPHALRSLKEAGFQLIVISNQTVVARGLTTEQEVYAINAEMERLLEQAGGPHLDGFYFCPHHPNATLPAYRIACECRKPRPGLLLRAAQEHNLDLNASFVVGDRITDIIAGARAGCRTVLLQTGQHQAPPIETVEPLDESVQPDHVSADLKAAVGWIQTLQNNEVVHPFSDMVMAPVPLPFAVNVLHRIAEVRMPGIIQVSGEKDVTYEQVGRHIAHRIGASPDLVQPIRSEEAALQLEAIPSHTTLDTTRLRVDLGMVPPDVWSAIDSVFGL